LWDYYWVSLSRLVGKYFGKKNYPIFGTDFSSDFKYSTDIRDPIFNIFVCPYSSWHWIWNNSDYGEHIIIRANAPKLQRKITAIY
jgi:hypothetical protein